LLLQPSPARAQTPPVLQCIGSGVTGCYWCDPNGLHSSPGGTGCTGTVTPPTNYLVGMCAPTPQAMTCQYDTMVCGKQINCATKKDQGSQCATLSICVSP